MTNQLAPKTVNPDSTYKTYCSACRKNNVKPVEEVDFLKGIVIGLSGVLSIASSTDSVAAITKFPVDEQDQIWCLMVPCGDGVTRIIFGPLDGVDETLENLQNSMEARHKGIAENSYEVSSVDQF